MLKLLQQKEVIHFAMYLSLTQEFELPNSTVTCQQAENSTERKETLSLE